MERLTINELLAMVGGLMLAGAALRTGETKRRRKPPGTIGST